MSEAIAAPAQFDPATDLDVAYRRYMESLIQLSGPSANTRASSIGLECERAIFYERTVPAEQRVRYRPELQAIFELGKDFEKIAVRRLEDMGAEIVQRGRDHRDSRLELSGHIDVRLKMPGWPRAIPAEIKGLNPYAAEGVDDIDDIRNNPQPWIRKYYAQLQSYLYLSSDPLGVFVLFNKSSGWPKFVNCELDYEYVEGLLKRSERLKLAVVQEAPPERTLGTHCERCQFVAICGPDIQFGPGVKIVDDAELELLLKRSLELQPAHAEYGVLQKEIAWLLGKTEGEILVGEYVVLRKKSEKKAEKVPRAASSFFRNEIRKVIK